MDAGVHLSAPKQTISVPRFMVVVIHQCFHSFLETRAGPYDHMLGPVADPTCLLCTKAQKATYPR